MVIPEETAGSAARVAAVVRSGCRSDLQGLEVDLERLARTIDQGAYERGVVDGLLKVVEAAAGNTAPSSGLAPQAAAFEPGSLPARMLLEIGAGVRGANADLADRLDTDQYQVSRAGRRLRELGLAERTRSGRLNDWSLTILGDREVARLRRSQ